ncbi:MAG: hypothetical protein KL787_04195 [Taibaiella sp.]|nr:hypothetical protein [Taibaiella sp.]
MKGLLKLVFWLLPIAWSISSAAQQDYDREQYAAYLEQEVTELERLYEKEAKYLKRFLKKQQEDSASADSLQHRESVAESGKVDSLKKIRAYLSRLDSATNELPAGLSAYRDRIERLEKLAGQNASLRGGIESRLEKLRSSGDIGAYHHLLKQYAILNSRMDFWKQKIREPDEAEQELLAYLQGDASWNSLFKKERQEGLRSSGDMQGMSIEELERMGFQTKRMVRQELESRFGTEQMGQMEEAMMQQLTEFTKPVEGFKTQYEQLKASKDALQHDLSSGREALGSVTESLRRPSSLFKNKMRGIPFRFRLEPLYSLRTSRPGPDGKPALLSGSAALLFRQTERFSLGAGLALDIGLGTGWRDIRISYQGLALQGITDYKLGYGFSFQAVYERRFGVMGEQSGTGIGENHIAEYFRSGSHALYAGCFKRYRVSSSYNGTLFIGYDFLWRQQGNLSPLVVKFGFSK